MTHLSCVVSSPSLAVIFTAKLPISEEADSPSFVLLPYKYDVVVTDIPMKSLALLKGFL